MIDINSIKLPSNWLIRSLETVCEILDSKRIPINNTERNARITGKKSSQLYPYYGATGEVGKIDDFIFDGEYVLVGEDGAPFLDPFKEKAYISTGKFWVNNHAHILKAHISNKYLCYFLNQFNYSDFVTGTTRLKLNQTALKNIPVIFAPLNEQKRIVAKIEELFSKLDNGIAALKTARKQLKVYRQAVLKHAFEGKLTAMWRDENADKLESHEQLLVRIQQERNSRYQQQLKEWKAAVKKCEANPKEWKKPSKPEEPEQISSVLASEVQDLYKLPSGWLFLRLGNFIDKIEAGKSFKCDEREPTSAEVGVAKVSAVTWGEYDESESKTCLDKAKVNPDYYIKKNDFILSRANTIELVGACVIAQKVTKAIMLSDKTLRINFTGIDQKYVLQYLRSHYGRNEIMERSTGNQESMRNIGQDRIRSIVIPVCSSSEMDLINNAVNKQLESILLLSKEIDTQILKTEILRQSILKKAFSGKLVPQDPNDEPTSELLARIKAVKVQQKQPAKKNRSSTVKKKVNQEA